MIPKLEKIVWIVWRIYRETDSLTLKISLLELGIAILRKKIKSADDKFDKDFCFANIKKLYFWKHQITETNTIINFLSKQVLNKNFKHNSQSNKAINDQNGSFHERVGNTVNTNVLLNKMIKKQTGEGHHNRWFNV